MPRTARQRDARAGSTSPRSRACSWSGMLRHRAAARRRAAGGAAVPAFARVGLRHLHELCENGYQGKSCAITSASACCASALAFGLAVLVAVPLGLWMGMNETVQGVARSADRDHAPDAEAGAAAAAHHLVRHRRDGEDRHHLRWRCSRSSRSARCRRCAASSRRKIQAAHGARRVARDDLPARDLPGQPARHLHQRSASASASA